jgi:hypothetical protein
MDVPEADELAAAEPYTHPITSFRGLTCHLLERHLVHRCAAGTIYGHRRTSTMPTASSAQ